MKLSIITPYYNTIEETMILVDVLTPQLTSDVEWIIVDDGCNETELDKTKANVIHLESNSGGAGRPRNIGIECSSGQYIVFLDSDDLVSQDFISSILGKIQEGGFDYCYYGWRDLCEDRKILITEDPPVWNTCVWNCIYSRALISSHRFNEALRRAEDEDFNARVRFGTKSSINKIIYFYNSGRQGSLTKNYEEVE